MKLSACSPPTATVDNSEDDAWYEMFQVKLPPEDGEDHQHDGRRDLQSERPSRGEGRRHSGDIPSRRRILPSHFASQVVA